MSLFSKNRILFPTDFSKLAAIAQQKTLEFVDNPTNLYIIHVLPPLSPTEPGVVWETLNEQTRKHNVEETFHHQFNTPEYQQVNFEVLFGEASKRIVEYAKEKDLELIVIPAYGRSGFNRFILGSVTERVVRFAHCPVYVWRSP